MIISHTHKFIFFAVPKTGTHAVRRALRPYLSDADQEQVGLFEKKSLPHPELAALKHGHISYLQLQSLLAEGNNADYFRFAFVRNPYDRFVSYCAFVSRKTGEFEADPRGFMRHVLFRGRPLGHLLFRPQHEFLVDADGRIAMTRVGKVENMQADYDAIAAQLGLPTQPLERVNSSSRKDFRGYYDEEMRAGVYDLYRRDFELFGYAENADFSQSR